MFLTNKSTLLLVVFSIELNLFSEFNFSFFNLKNLFFHPLLEVLKTRPFYDESVVFRNWYSLFYYCMT